MAPGVVGEEEGAPCRQACRQPPGVWGKRAASGQVGHRLRRSGRSLFYSHGHGVGSHLHKVFVKDLNNFANN